jgi:hypothetical protein
MGTAAFWQVVGGKIVNLNWGGLLTAAKMRAMPWSKVAASIQPTADRPCP